jgi:hypothetical protein
MNLQIIPQPYGSFTIPYQRSGAFGTTHASIIPLVPCYEYKLTVSNDGFSVWLNDTAIEQLDPLKWKVVYSCVPPIITTTFNSPQAVQKFPIATPPKLIRSKKFQRRIPWWASPQKKCPTCNVGNIEVGPSCGCPIKVSCYVCSRYKSPSKLHCRSCNKLIDMVQTKGSDPLAIVPLPIFK